MYRTGEGVQQDNKASFKWIKLAAGQGETHAQDELGFMYAEGIGVQRDYIHAYMWWNISASQGNENASRKRDKIKKLMAPAMIENTQRLTRECVKKNYKGC